MPKVFISYRRDDSAFPAHLIYQRLASDFDRGSVFIDVDTIPPGIDFRDHLNQAVGHCDILLAIIGKHWLNAQNADGTRRLADPQDFVRIEIQAALQRDIPVIPVLLDGAEMPTEGSLPEDLAQLAYRNAVQVYAGRDFDSHVDNLVERLERLLTEMPTGSDGSTATGAVSLNDQVFRELRLLGRGGMGEVWLAYDETLKRHVALKRIRQELLNDREAQRRFIQEARDCAKLNHPNIVRILSIDRDQRGPFLVLELMEGGNLRWKLDEGKLKIVEALAYLRQMLLALKCAHEERIIHRDIKPENILLTKSGVPKLGDFGLAWLLEDTSASQQHSQRSTKEGTFSYVAPELQNSNESPGPKSDIYSLGITFFEMITGLHPSRVREKKVPSAVLPILKRMTLSNPNLRYQTADEALHDVLELERSIELAGRTRSESLGRVSKTVQQGFDSISAGKPVDALSCFERVIAELPDHDGATAGLLLLNLIQGEIAEASRRFKALLEANAKDPVFQRIRDYFETIPRPTILFATPQVMPFSYLIDPLRSGRFIKELIEVHNRTINLGDVGELLVELYQQKPDAIELVQYVEPRDGQHSLEFGFPDVTVRLDYRFQSTPGGMFLPAKLHAIGLILTVDGTSMDIYRLVRFLAYNLRARFRRNHWVDPEVAASFQLNAAQSMQQWQYFLCRFEDFAYAATGRN